MPDSPAPQAQEGNVIANGLSLHYRWDGPTEGEVVLLIMGLAGQLIHWPDSLVQALNGLGYRVLRMDNRDAGLSADGPSSMRVNIPRTYLRSKFGLTSPSNYRLSDMADDAAALLDALGVDRAHWVGASMGGMISQIAAGKHPHKVASLTSIMSSSNAGWLPPARLDLLKRMSGFGPRPVGRSQITQHSAQLMAMMGSPGYPTPMPQRVALAERAYDRAFRPGGILRQTHAISASGSIQSWLKRITAPTLVLHGAADPLLKPAHGRHSARCIPNAQLRVVDGMGHDFPDLLMPQWAEWIHQNARRKA